MSQVYSCPTEPTDQPIGLLTPDELYTRADADLLFRLREDKRLERKPSGITPEALSEYLSMWANTSPDGGLIVVGQKDAKDGGGVEDIKAGENRINKLETAPRRFCPEATVSHRRVPVRNDCGQDDFLVLMRVKYHEGRVVRNNKREAYARFGDEKHKLTDVEIRELKANKGQRHPELDPSPLPYPEGYDRDDIATFTARVKQMRDLAPYHTNEAILQIMKLGHFADDKQVKPLDQLRNWPLKDPVFDHIVFGAGMLLRSIESLKVNSGTVLI